MPLISLYNAEDHDGVWALHQKTVRENEGFVKNLSFHSDIHNIPTVYKAFFVMRDNGKIIGMIGLKQVAEKEYEIKRLQVDATYQGRGYGKKLMETAIDYARANDVSILHLDVSETQASARNLYLSMGFVVTRKEWCTYGPDNEKFLSTFMEKKFS